QASHRAAAVLPLDHAQALVGGFPRLEESPSGRRRRGAKPRSEERGDDGDSEQHTAAGRGAPAAQEDQRGEQGQDRGRGEERPREAERREREVGGRERPDDAPGGGDREDAAAGVARRAPLGALEGLGRERRNAAEDERRRKEEDQRRGEAPPPQE